MPAVVSQATREIDRVLALREAARRNYRDFIRLSYEGSRQRILWNWHIDFLADVMQAVALRQVKRVLVNIPPRHLKSTIISQLWHAWMIGRDDSPQSSLLSCGVAQALASRDSRRTLATLNSDWYKATFPRVQLNRENEAEWETQGGAYRIAVGVGGTVTGRGADHVTFDDILKADSADSELVREDTNEWLGETLATRLNDPKLGTITGIMQRLHERDPTGYLLEQQKRFGADQWEHIVLPLEAPKRTVVEFNFQVYQVREAGTLLHPERIGPHERDALKAAMRNNYDGQYQQNPTKMQGSDLDPRRYLRLQGDGLAIKSMFGIRPYAYIDLAASEKQTQKDDPDYTAIIIAGRDSLDRLVILDIWRQRTPDFAVVARTLIQMFMLWRFKLLKFEKGPFAQNFATILTQQGKLVGAIPPFVNIARTNDKVTRSRAFQGLLNAGIVAVPERAPWLPDFEAETRSFPRGAHDDMLDGCFDAAADYGSMLSADTPITHPDDPAIQLQNEIHDRIAKKVQQEMRRQQYGDEPESDWDSGTGGGWE